MNEPLVDWGVAELTLAGQKESGDRHLVKPFSNGVLMAVVDGLGHGQEAAAAARMAVATLEHFAHESVIALAKRCHERLRWTRGAVMSLARFDRLDGTMTWLGIGNVEGILLRRKPSDRPLQKTLLLRGGVVGSQIPPLQASVLPIRPGDTLILATDGIRSGFATDLILKDSPQQLAGRILATHGKGTDDALVLVASYLGGAP